MATEITTPFGTALYPNLTRPSYRFQKKQGEFSVKLRIPDGPEAEALVAQLDEAYDANVEKETALWRIENPKKKGDPDFELAARPYKRAVDEDGNDLGAIEISARLKHRYFPKQGQPFSKKPLLVDAAGTPMTEEIGAGSELRLSVELFPYNTQFGCGVALRLKGAQVKRLVGREGTAEDMGFDAVDGFETSGIAPEPEEIPAEPVAAADTDSKSLDEDF